MDPPTKQPVQAPPGAAKPGADATEERKRQLLSKSEVSIWIDTYDDIFSDFDPRPYRERSLSVDFLEEAKRYSRNKGGKLQLRFLAPHATRNARMEAVIKKRLLEHFKRHAGLVVEEQGAIKTKGRKFIFAGSVILLTATLILHYMPETLIKDFLTVLLEPAGWFTIWSGFDMVVLDPQTLKPDLDFYTKMSTADIVFEGY